MIFGEDLIEKILAGRKTETRRLVGLTKDGMKPCPYRVGSVQAVQPGRGEKAVARIAIMAVELAHLGQIEPLDAYAEGFDSIAEFQDYWIKLYGDGPDSDGERLVYAITFRLGFVRNAKDEWDLADATP